MLCIKRSLVQKLNTDSGAYIWNRLSTALRTACSLQAFKHRLHDYITSISIHD